MQAQTEFSRLRELSGLSIDILSEKLGFSPRTLYRWDRGETEPREAALHVLRSLATKLSVNDSDQPAFTFIDLFAGIGGLRKGFEPLGGRCIFTSEWNEYSQQTYKANFQCDHEVAGDITKIHAEDIPAHDLLLAGFPCQPFSIAGVSKKNALGRQHGFRCEAQGTLFFDVARIIEHHRPRAFLLENVKNLVNHDKGRTFKVIHDTLKNELGYQVHWKVIDAKSFVPQHRERIFIVGFREPNSFTFDNLVLPDRLKGPKLRTILHTEDGTEQAEGHYTTGKKVSVAKKYTLTDHLWGYLQDYAEKHREKGNGFGFGLCGPDDVARTLSARYYKDGSEILIKQRGKNPRRLTPRECARLMGFDRPGQPLFKIPVSDTQSYKQFGNAVVVPVVEAVARHMAPWILEGGLDSEYAQGEFISLYG
jgi:DNA (cytosine-5)-methyltransferase 1